MPKISLGRLEKVNLNEVWKHEALDFTPWLAQENNLALLGEALGIELELEAQEKQVGPFRADILCKDTANGNWVLIENQIGRTDHTHLGQILTYASGLKAVTIVWIARKFTDEHRSALDWLNEVTDEQINFFGLEIELWRIGDSPAAAKFNIISQPNEWQRAVDNFKHEIAAGSAGQLQFEYWSALKDFILNSGSKIRPAKPSPQHWQTYAIGSSQAQLVSTLNTRESRLGVYLELLGNNAKVNYHRLQGEKAAIEAEIGHPLEWQEKSTVAVSQILTHLTQIEPEDRSKWPEYFAWTLKELEAFDRVFRPRVQNLRQTNDLR